MRPGSQEVRHGAERHLWQQQKAMVSKWEYEDGQLLEHQLIIVTSSSLSLSIQPWCPKPDIMENPGTTFLGEGKNKAEWRMTMKEVWNYD